MSIPCHKGVAIEEVSPQKALMTKEFLGIDHIGIAVDDYASAVCTYRDILGFSIENEEELLERGLQVCFVNTGGQKLELLGSMHEHSEISTFLTKRGAGVHHVCIRVADIEATVATMEKNGAQIIKTDKTNASGISSGAHHTRVAFLHPKSTHGVLLELVEHPIHEHN